MRPRSRFPGRLGGAPRLFELFLGRQQGVPVHEGPAQILGIRKFKPLGVQRFGQSNKVMDLFDIVAVQDDVYRHGDAKRMRPASDGQLLFVNYQTGDAIREQLVRGLKRQLDGVQAARAKAYKAPAVERDTAGDEIGI